jgi:uncharacterized membrane protein YgdD (TMEM256/DUF423 family)
MQKFWQLSFSLAAVYGAIVIGMSAAISHLFSHSLEGRALSSLLSSAAVLAFQTLALMAISYVQLQQTQSATRRLATLWPVFVVAGFHLGLWLFVYTVWAGIFALPMHFSQLAPMGGQLLLVSWLLLAVTPWIRK